VRYWAEIYELPNYVPVKRSEITDIEFYIKDEAGNYASLLTNPSHCISGLFHFTAMDCFPLCISQLMQLSKYPAN
jgi:hypothetical protein